MHKETWHCWHPIVVRLTRFDSFSERCRWRITLTDIVSPKLRFSGLGVLERPVGESFYRNDNGLCVSRNRDSAAELRRNCGLIFELNRKICSLLNALNSLACATPLRRNPPLARCLLLYLPRLVFVSGVWENSLSV